MKILHTADWHIGKKLHKHDLSTDFELFVDWLVAQVSEQEVDVLLVSGDVFDLANPSSESRAAYYKAMVRLSQLKCQLILTGGNHDSPAVLNAPRELMKQLNIHVVGSLPENIHKPQQVKAAVPVYYSGSPIPLSFSEHRDQKRVLLKSKA